MIKKLKAYLKKDRSGALKIAALFCYADTAAIRSWIRRDSIPSYIEPRLNDFLNGDVDVTISIK